MKPANLRKVMIYLLTSCNTEERIAQNIYIHNSNRNIKKKKKKKKINYKNNFNQETDRHFYQLEFDKFAAGPLFEVFSNELVSGCHSRLIIKFCC